MGGSGKSFGLHRGVSVCFSFLYQEWGEFSDGSVDRVGDQQSSYFLWGKLCGNISGNEKAVSIYDFFIDR